MRPAGHRRHPEDVFGRGLVPVLSSVRAPLGEHCLGTLLEGVGDVLEEDQLKDDMLVLGGVHQGAQSVRRRPQLGSGRGRPTSTAVSETSEQLPGKALEIHVAVTDGLLMGTDGAVGRFQ